jgi:hypothetical protein
MNYSRVGVFIKYKENTTKQFRVYTLDLDYVIRFFIITFDELKKDGTVNLRFRDTQNTLLDRELRNRPKNKILRLKEQKTVLKPPRQFKDYDINPTESRLIISVEVLKKSVT